MVTYDGQRDLLFMPPLKRMWGARLTEELPTDVGPACFRTFYSPMIDKREEVEWDVLDVDRRKIARRGNIG